MFFHNVCVFSTAIGSFFVEGHKALLCTEYRRGMQALAPLAAWREKISREEGSRKGARIAKVCTIHVWIVSVLFSALTSAHKNITFAASTLKQKSYAERKSQLSGSLRSVSAPSMVNYDKFMNSNWNLHLKSRS